MQTGDTPAEDNSSPSLQVLNWTRLHQLIKQYGVTGVILVLLAHQMGWLGTAQTGVCGL